MKPNILNRIFQVIIKIVLVIVAIYIIKHFIPYLYKSKEDLTLQNNTEHVQFDTTAFFMEIVNSNNKVMPIWINKDLRCDNMVTLGNKEIIYNYTLVNLSNVDKKGKMLYNLLYSGSKNEMINYINTEPKFTELKKFKPTFIYNYKDNTGNYLFNITIKPDEYK